VNFISTKEVIQSLQDVGVGKGDVLLVHSNAMAAAQLPPMADEQRLDVLIEALQTAVGQAGTLVMPTFTYSFTKQEPFDVCQTPSTVGMLTERFRTRDGTLRSPDPIFSFAARGAKAEELCSIPAKECFGKESFFAALHEMNCLILCLGCSLTDGGTFVHYIEKSHGVDYRYNKTFHGATITPDGKPHSTSVIYYVRDLNRNSHTDLQCLYERLESEKSIRTGVMGRIRIFTVRAADLFNTAWKMLDEDPTSLIAEKTWSRAV
jgi:aminoglycoside 3-N-acetyltransferase